MQRHTTDAHYDRRGLTTTTAAVQSKRTPTPSQTELPKHLSMMSGLRS